jgi:membrane protease YdiL (CAAX protease family)
MDHSGPRRLAAKAALHPATASAERAAFVVTVVLWPFYIDDVLSIPKGGGVSLWLLDALRHDALPLLTVWLLQRTGTISMRSLWEPSKTRLQRQLSLAGPDRLHSLARGVVLWACTLVFVDLFFYRIVAHYAGHANGCVPSFPERPMWRLLSIAYASASAGFVEELVFRGVVTARLCPVVGSLATIVLTSFLFATAHWCQGTAAMLTHFLWSWILTSWYLRTKDLFAVIVCHTLCDVVIFSGLKG